MGWVRLGCATLYVVLVGGFFVAYYLDVRGAPPDTLVDVTPLVILLAVVSLPVGIVIGRLWAVALPLVAVPFAVVAAAFGAVDERYAAVARDRGGELGLGWLAIAALLCAYALPAMAFGVALVALGRDVERSLRRRSVEGGRSRPPQRPGSTRR